jgi:hypothetical protein
MHAGSVIETLYCTQQVGGLTRGMTLSAIRIIEARHSLWTRTGSKLTAIRNPTRILRAMRYRAVLRCWAFRPNPNDPSQRAVGGGLIGGAAGAGIGGLAGGGSGALIGGLAGAAVGAGTGYITTPQRRY